MRDRKSGLEKNTSHDSDGSEIDATKQGPAILPTYDCGGAIHIKFSLKREAINVVYKHNPIHTTRPVADRYVASKLSLRSLSRWYSTPTDMICSPPVLAADNHLASLAAPVDGKQSWKRKRSNKAETEVDNEYRDPNLDMSTSPEPVGSSARKRKTRRAVESPKSGRKTPTKQNKKAKTFASPQGHERRRLLVWNLDRPCRSKAKLAFTAVKKRSSAMRQNPRATSAVEAYGHVNMKSWATRSAPRMAVLIASSENVNVQKRGHRVPTVFA